MLLFQTLRSGSSGNLLLLEGGSRRPTRLLIDCGVSSQQRCLQILEEEVGIDGGFDGLIVTHAHSDHINYATLRVMDRLPPLDRCDQIGFQSLGIGFLLLTIGIATGVLVNTAVYDKLWVPGVKQTFPLLAWIVFAVVLAARFKLGVRGRRSAYLTIVGVLLGLATVAGMTL